MDRIQQNRIYFDSNVRPTHLKAKFNSQLRCSLFLSSHKSAWVTHPNAKLSVPKIVYFYNQIIRFINFPFRLESKINLHPSLLPGTWETKERETFNSSSYSIFKWNTQRQGVFLSASGTRIRNAKIFRKVEDSFNHCKTIDYCKLLHCAISLLCHVTLFTRYKLSNFLCRNQLSNPNPDRQSGGQTKKRIKFRSQPIPPIG